MAAIDKLLVAAIQNQVESVYFEPGRLPRFRRGTSDQEVTQSALDARAIDRLLREIAPDRRMPDPALEPRWSFDYEVEGVNFRFVGVAVAAGWTVLATASSPIAARAAAGSHAGAAAPSEKGPRALPPVDALLRTAVDLGATELHLSANGPPRLRLNGELSRLETYEAPSSARLKELLYEIAPKLAREDFEATNDALFAHEIVDFARFRVRFCRDQQGVGASFRQVAATPPSVASLNLPADVADLAMLVSGLVLVAGAPGSGRTSVWNALIDAVNATRKVEIAIFEQPIESIHTSKVALVRQREIPTHVLGFVAGIDAATDADVIALGRIPDADALSHALAAAASGKLVLAVIDGISAAHALERLVTMAPADRAESIRGALANELRAVTVPALSREKDGRSAFSFELLPASADVAYLIREGAFYQLAALVAAGRDDGMFGRRAVS